MDVTCRGGGELADGLSEVEGGREREGERSGEQLRLDLSFRQRAELHHMAAPNLLLEQPVRILLTHANSHHGPAPHLLLSRLGEGDLVASLVVHDFGPWTTEEA